MHKAKSQGRYLFIFVTHSVRYSDHQPEIIYCCARTEREAFQYIHRKVGKYISVRMIACVRRRSGWHFIQHFTDTPLSLCLIWPVTRGMAQESRPLQAVIRLPLTPNIKLPIRCAYQVVVDAVISARTVKPSGRQGQQGQATNALQRAKEQQQNMRQGWSVYEQPEEPFDDDLPF
ncbi:hypothetical protein ACX1G9_10085 [Yersinia enterocolitica]